MQTNPVANHLLWIAFQHKDDDDLTPAKVQKLMYFLHGWYLAVTGELLLTERFVHGKYGPLLPGLQREIQRYNGIPVDDYIRDVDLEAGAMRPYFVNYEALPQFEAVLKKVWEQYGRLPLTHLASMATAAGSPWARTSPGQPIANEMIFEDFVRQGADNAARGIR